MKQTSCNVTFTEFLLVKKTLSPYIVHGTLFPYVVHFTVILCTLTHCSISYAFKQVDKYAVINIHKSKWYTLYKEEKSNIIQMYIYILPKAKKQNNNNKNTSQTSTVTQIIYVHKFRTYEHTLLR